MKEKIVNYLLSKQWFISIVRQRYLSAIEDIDYNAHAEGCGLEDNGITDRYDAMAYGYERGVDAAFEAVDNVA
jgi:hypothetical protein